MINWLINHWLWFAIPLSAFWGVYGVAEDKNEKENWEKHLWIKWPGIFISEFIGSFAGWCFLYILALRLSKDIINFRIVDILLAIGAVVGIAGYSYKIGEFIANYTKNYTN
jgi:hypothetical protein